MYYFCTYYDSHYLKRGLALYQSLRCRSTPFRLYILCMDLRCFDTLQRLRLPHVTLIPLHDLEKDDQNLLRVKQDRTKVEYYFTCTPSLPLFLFRNFEEPDVLTYLDADLFFFETAEEVYHEIADYSIAIIPHRYSPNLHHRYKYGTYNVGWLSFRRDSNGLSCLQWWRERCIEWCYDRVEKDRYADQKYLDQWPYLFKNLVVLQHKGANLAPWNLMNYTLSYDGCKIWVDDQPLVFFHFQGFKQIYRWLYDPNFAGCRVKLDREVKRYLLGPYIQTLMTLDRLDPPDSSKRILPEGIRFDSQRSTLSLYLRFLIDRLAVFIISAIHRNYVVVRNGRIL